MLPDRVMFTSPRGSQCHPVLLRGPEPQLTTHHCPRHGPLPAQAEAALAVEDRGPEPHQGDEAVSEAGVLEDVDAGCGAP